MAGTIPGSSPGTAMTEGEVSSETTHDSPPEPYWPIWMKIS
jgi:hypothetical protein